MRFKDHVPSLNVNQVAWACTGSNYLPIDCLEVLFNTSSHPETGLMGPLGKNDFTSSIKNIRSSYLLRSRSNGRGSFIPLLSKLLRPLQETGSQISASLIDFIASRNVKWLNDDYTRAHIKRKLGLSWIHQKRKEIKIDWSLAVCILDSHILKCLP